jgi:hypothetical protein
MALRILDSPEPYTEASEARRAYNAPGDWRRTRFAESEVYRRLCREVYRYATGDISGRSYLIAGHRGSGKTTAVLKAIEDTEWRLRGEGARRPLVVRLYGPDLLPAQPQVNGDFRHRSNGRHDSADSAGTPQVPVQVLTEIARAIYQAAANEVANAYRARALAHRPLSQILFPWLYVLFPGLSRGGEMAAQLRVQLDEAPDFATLRGFWRSRWLQDGVLGARVSYWIGLYRALVPPDFFSTRDRGYLELVALSSAAEAYRRIIGETREKEEAKSKAVSKDTLTVESKFNFANIAKSLASFVAASAAVGFGLHTFILKALLPEWNAILSAVAALFAGLSAAVVTLNVTYSNSRARESAASREVTFLPDTSLTSLSRTLPALVDRFRAAGLAPVFVIDELDKVADLPVRMGELIGHLKQFVTEKAFSCFLTNRDYLEWLRTLSSEKAYPPEHSFFSDRLFILLTPEDLHHYLGEVISASEDPNEQHARQVLTYVLMHRSQMHPIDLRRQISQFQNDRGEVFLPTMHIIDRFPFDVLVQVAIEFLLTQPELADKLTRDPDFRQLAYDTLYYPSRNWQGDTLDISKAEFRRYLRNRMNASGLETSTFRSDSGFTESDLDFLHLRLRQLVNFLADPSVLTARLTPSPEGPLTEQVMDLLRAIPREGLLDGTANPAIFEWRYDASGRPLKPLKVDAVLAEDLTKRKELIRFVEQNLGPLTDGVVNLQRLAVEMRVLPAAPAWPTVEEALRRLDELDQDRAANKAQPYPEMQSDRDSVWAYAEMLRRNGGTMTRAILSARAIGRLCPGSPADQIVAGFAILRSKLKLAALSDSGKAKKIQDLTDSLAALTRIVFGGLPDTFEADAEAKTLWQQTSSAASNALFATPTLATAALPQYAETLLQTWRDRFTLWLRDGVMVFPPTIQDLLIAAGPAAPQFPELDLADMTLQRWMSILFLALAVQPPPPYVIPFAFQIPALFALGFRQLAARSTYEPVLVNSINIPPDRDAVALWSSPLQTQAQKRRGALILVYSQAHGPDSFTASWLPSTRYAALRCTPAEWNLLSSSRLFVGTGLDLKHDFGIDTVMVELAAETSIIEKTLSTPPTSLPPDILPPSLNDPKYTIKFLVADALPNVTNPTHRVVVAPSSLDDAMDRVT